MEVSLTQDQEAFIRQAIDSGRFHRQEDAVHEALCLWEGRERRRAEFLATLDDAKASLACSEGRTITQESMRELAGDVKRDAVLHASPPSNKLRADGAPRCAASRR